MSSKNTRSVIAIAFLFGFLNIAFAQQNFSNPDADIRVVSNGTLKAVVNLPNNTKEEVDATPVLVKKLKDGSLVIQELRVIDQTQVQTEYKPKNFIQNQIKAAADFKRKTNPSDSPSHHSTLNEADVGVTSGFVGVGAYAGLDFFKWDGVAINFGVIIPTLAFGANTDLLQNVLIFGPIAEGSVGLNGAQAGAGVFSVGALSVGGIIFGLYGDVKYVYRHSYTNIGVLEKGQNYAGFETNLGLPLLHIPGVLALTLRNIQLSLAWLKQQELVGNETEKRKFFKAGLKLFNIF